MARERHGHGILCVNLIYTVRIWFTQCGRVWFTFDMPCPCHAPTMPFFSRPQQNTAVFRRPCSAVALRRTAWSEHGIDMANVNQTRLHCVNQMGKTHSKILAVRHGRGTAWARHSNVNRPLLDGVPCSCLAGWPHKPAVVLYLNSTTFPPSLEASHSIPKRKYIESRN